MWRNCTHLHKSCLINSLKPSFISTRQSLQPLQRILKGSSCHTLSRYQNLTYNANSQYTKRLQHTQHQPLESVSDEQGTNSFTYRTHTCGELRPVNEGQKVTLCGWVQFVRMSKFLLLRDGYGLTQCIVRNNKENISDIPLETVIKIVGTVAVRPKNMVNPQMDTGEIEVIIDKLETLNTVDKLPFNLRDYQKPKEHLRLQHRYIDLRFPEMQHNLRLRSKMLHNMRRFLIEKHSFVEVETPTLFCRTPGGAREFVVPTHHSGLFYSLVQSPQQFKQMLMSGGIDRYFQIARCYRDESTRPDRQLEFTQLDVELSFTSLDGVLTLIENLLYENYTKALPRPPFNRLTYKEAIDTYGTDKPNLTYELTLQNIKHFFPRKINSNEFDASLMAFPKEFGKFTEEMEESLREIVTKHNTKIIPFENIQKFFGTYFYEKVMKLIGEDNHCIISLGTGENASLTLGEAREYLAPIMKSKNLLTIQDSVKPVWIVDFPLFIKGENGLETCHHPFTAPHPDDLHHLDSEPLKVRSLAYDLVLNGNEVAGGSVRIHNAELQEKILKTLNIDSEPLTHLLNALKCGCPPHAGIALGIDRLVSLACEAESIRDVIAFPKSHDGKDPLSGAPNIISEADKKYYHIK